MTNLWRAVIWPLKKLWAAISRWAAALARLFAAYPLPILACAFLLVSLVTTWVDFPFSRDLKGLQYPLLLPTGVVPHLRLCSYGLIATGLLVTGLVVSRFSSTFLTLCAASLLTLCLLAPLQIAFQQPTLLRRLTTEVRAVSAIREFTKHYLPQNYGNVANVPSHLALDTAWGRFSAAYSFLGVGWFCFAIAALLLAGAALARNPHRRPLTIAILAAVPFAVFALLLIRPVCGEYYFLQALKAKSNARNQEAIVDYRKAMAWEPWYRQGIDIYETIGDLEWQLNPDTDSPEVHIYKGEQFKSVSMYEPAIFELDHAANSHGDVSVAARRESALTRIDFGLALYRMNAVGAAVTNWQRAVNDDPMLNYTLFLLAHGNFELSRYQPALEDLRNVIKSTSHDTILSNSYSLAGDCYSMLGIDGEARRFYMLSLSIDILDNHWAMSALIGH